MMTIRARRTKARKALLVKIQTRVKAQLLHETRIDSKLVLSPGSQSQRLCFLRYTKEAMKIAATTAAITATK